MKDNNTQTSGVELGLDNQKGLLIQQLKKTPIVQVACEKVGVGRTIYYQWLKEDKEFAEAVDMAVTEGSGLVNDLAESQLMTAIKEGNLAAVTFWLKHHHKAYATKIEVTASLKQPLEELTPEQQALVEQALQMAYSTTEAAEQDQLSVQMPEVTASTINKSFEDNNHATGEPEITII